MAKISTVYIEHEVLDHPRTQMILSKLGDVRVIHCDHYGEIFNLKNQNFRHQKQNPSLILAHKKEGLVLPTPEGFGIGGLKNYYFSAMYNCPFDCRYCFLQGLYDSAHYVVFVNLEDYLKEIREIEAMSPGGFYFSGYDADSLALSHLTGFATSCLEAFRTMPSATLEFRTKSLQIAEILRAEPLDNVVVAFSLTPDAISKHVEHRVPPVAKRLKAMAKLSEAGWNIGLRLDPLIYHEEFEAQYRSLLLEIFGILDPKRLHSISLGPLRFPQKMYKKVRGLYPEDPLLAHPFHKRGTIVSYTEAREKSMLTMLRRIIHQYADDSQVFSCHNL